MFLKGLDVMIICFSKWTNPIAGLAGSKSSTHPACREDRLPRATRVYNAKAGAYTAERASLDLPTAKDLIRVMPA